MSFILEVPSSPEREKFKKGNQIEFRHGDTKYNQNSELKSLSTEEVVQLKDIQKQLDSNASFVDVSYDQISTKDDLTEKGISDVLLSAKILADQLKTSFNGKKVVLVSSEADRALHTTSLIYRTLIENEITPELYTNRLLNPIQYYSQEGLQEFMEVLSGLIASEKNPEVEMLVGSAFDNENAIFERSSSIKKRAELFQEKLSELIKQNSDVVYICVSHHESAGFRLLGTEESKEAINEHKSSTKKGGFYSGY